MRIRDPIHRSIELSRGEGTIVDHPWVQRLRGVSQTGFAALPFPGATHSRFSHSLGVMHLAGMAFDRVYRGWSFDAPDASARFRAAVRLAALCHDLGHAPLSHCTEFAMPTLAALQPGWTAPDARRATHEDYTLAILEHTSLATAVADAFPFEARHVAALLSPEVRTGDDFFRDGGFNHRRLLSQLVSSELDVDRLDYLVRDATYTGATYGHIDVDWLLGNLRPWPVDGTVALGLDARALYAFDDFLIARHHMFLMVYFHHLSVVYEEMLKRHVRGADSAVTVPADLDAYLRFDDAALTHALRSSPDDWARRITERRPWSRALERHGAPGQADLQPELHALERAGIDAIGVTSTGRISRYSAPLHRRTGAAGIWVVQDDRTASPLASATHIFERYADARCISRVYVAPERLAAARRALGLDGWASGRGNG